MQDQSPVGGAGFLSLVFNASLETQVVLGICAVFSIASWFVIAAKWWEFRRLRSRRIAFYSALERTRSFDERLAAMASLGESPYADLVRITSSFIADLRASMQRGGVERTGLSLTQLDALTLTLDAAVGEVTEQARRMIPLLAIVAASAPLLGLFGTVLGIIRAFLGIGTAGTGNIGAVAPGIADALIATAAGLAAAIPAVIAYNVFTARSERLEGELERIGQQTVGTLGREGRL